jgi:methionyl-tRNA formyltransferase
MKKMSKTIVFFGSGPVAARSLRLLAQAFEIEVVITKPRPPHHRGSMPVLEAAKELKLPVLTVRNKHGLDKLFASKPVTSELGILIDFGIMLSKPILDYFPLGIINSHFSLLPEWRGADPISFSILSGQPQTGVSLMQVIEALDEGPLLAYGVYDLPPDITTPVLTEHLINFSNMLLQRTIPTYFADQKPGEPQDVTGRPVSYSHKLTKKDGLIDWHKPASQLEREVRAFLGWPRSQTKLYSKDVVVTKAHIADGSGKPGTLRVQDQELGVYTGDGVLVIDGLIPAGKKEMSGAAFLAGYKTD